MTARKLGAPTFRFYASPSYLARRGEPREYGYSSHDWIVFGPLLKFHKPPVAIRFLSSDLAGRKAQPAACREHEQKTRGPHSLVTPNRVTSYHRRHAIFGPPTEG